MKCGVIGGLIVLLSGALCACGQKGPLVLPDAAKRKHTIPALPGAAAPKGAAPSGPAPPTSPAPPEPESTPAHT